MDLFYGLALKYVRWMEVMFFKFPMFLYICFISLFLENLSWDSHPDRPI